jgi:hypothetical protein
MQLVRRLPYYGSLLLLAYMPFHVFLSQSISLLTGGLDEWKVAKDVFLAILAILTISLVWWDRKATRLFNILVALTTAYGLLLLGVWAAHPSIYRTSAVLGVTYDLRLFVYAIVGFGAVLLTPVKPRLILKLVLIVSTIVAIIGIVQYFLPTDILTHFGYSIARGARPNFFIDNNPEFPRIMSTIRDPNSLGAYLLVPVSLLTALLLRARSKERYLFGGLLTLQLIAVYLTFGRSAWAGAALVIALVVWWQYRQWFMRITRRYWPVLVVLLLLAGGLTYSQRNNPLLTHQTNEQVGNKDSNQYHWFFAHEGLEGIVHDPWGHGPGTAGLVSIQNPHGGLLTENYYLQIGYEIGVAGLMLFIALQVFVYVNLWHHRHSYLGLAVVTTFWAYVLINMLLQSWSNEAVACQWWLIAGLVLAQPLGKAKAD